MSNKNEVFEYLIDQLRQQVNKKDVTSFNVSVQISDLDDVKQVIHNLQQHIAGKDDEIRALKDSLRDASAQIKELYGALDAELKYSRKFREEQSGCRKEDAQECEHSWIIMLGLFLSEGNPDNVPGSELCSKCGKREWDDEEYKPKNDTSECEHDWYFYDKGASMMCKKCGLKK